MNNLAIYKKSGQDQVYEKLRHLITSHAYEAQERLAPVRALAKEFRTSACTVQLAIGRLEENGYVIRRPRVGVFVAEHRRPISMKDMVAVCMGGRGDHVWGDLAGMLCGSIAGKGQVPVVLDLEQNDCHRLMERMCHTDSQCFVVRGRLGVPCEMMFKPPFDKKTIIAVFEFLSRQDRPGLYRVLSDPHEGVRQVVEHLLSLGHRKVLVVGQPCEIDDIQCPPEGIPTVASEFVAQFTAAGGQCDLMASEDGTSPRINTERFISFFRQAQPPTAVFGLQDCYAWAAQETFRHQIPELYGKIAIVGYFDAPWSQMASPAITTVSLDIEGIVSRVQEILDAVNNGLTPDATTYRVCPRLIVRNTSVPVTR